LGTLRRNIHSGLFGIALLASALGAGCSARVSASPVTVYDSPHHDWHHWDDAERQAYRRYWEQKKEPYRTYGSLSQEDEDAYWNWRHTEGATAR
jgi:hypothetical protein